MENEVSDEEITAKIEQEGHALARSDPYLDPNVKVWDWLNVTNKKLV